LRPSFGTGVNVDTGVTHAERLARVSEILIELFRSPVPTHFFQTLGDQAAMAVPCDYLAVCLHDQENGGYLVHSLATLDDGGAVGQRVFAPGEGLPGMVMRTGTASVVPELGAIDTGAHDLEGVLAAAGLRAALVVPIRRGLEVLGALLFAGRPPIAYGDDDLQVAHLLAAGLSAALGTSDAVIMMNPAGLVLLANAAVRPMLGLQPDAITGRPLLEVVDYAPLRELFVAAEPGISELPLPDGRTAQASLVQVVTPFGEPVGLAAVLRDITLLKNLEQMKNDFVNTVSHDLKGPITVIAGMADLMRMAGPADPDHESRCQDIRDSAQHMADLVTDLLDIGKIEAGLDSAREPTDLVPVIGEALRMVKPRAEPKRIELVAELVDEAIVSAVPSRIRQVLINLLDNGVKYTPDGGRVTISAALSRGDVGAASAVIVRVTDTGIGIPAKDLPHVFDKFYRVKSKATSEIAGTGLGLAITRSIVEAYDGRIRVESVEEAGTTFVVELPLVRA
jgi:signal transduction histidine kinase